VVRRGHRAGVTPLKPRQHGALQILYDDDDDDDDVLQIRDP